MRRFPVPAHGGIRRAGASIDFRKEEVLATLSRKIFKSEALLYPAVLVVFGALSFMRNFVWTDEIALWRDASSKSPGIARALNNFGDALRIERRYEEAIPVFIRAIKNDPWYVEPHYNLAASFVGTERYDDAIPEFDTVLRINAVLKGGHFGERFSSRNELGAHANLGNIYNVKGMLGEAVSHYKEAIAISKDDASVRFNLAITYKRLGMLKEAKAEFEEVLRINPSDEGARQNLSIIGGR